MSYKVTFEKGGFSFNSLPEKDLKNFINNFSKSKHVLRNPKNILKKKSWRNYSFFGDIGEDGEYYSNPRENDFYDGDKEHSILDFNAPPVTQPSCWCNWVIKNNQLTWNGNSDFDNFAEWLDYLIDNFFKPRGYELNGKLNYQGEDSDDYGYVSIDKNIVTLGRIK